jgi:hypothetical protein
VKSRGVLNELLLLEPKSNLSLGRLNRVRAVSNVATNINGVITTDGTRGRLKRVGGTKNGTTLLDNILTLPNGGKNGARSHVREQTGEEGLLLEIRVVLTEELLRGLGKLDGNKLEATRLESGDDGGNEATLDTIGL